MSDLARLQTSPSTVVPFAILPLNFGWATSSSSIKDFERFSKSNVPINVKPEVGGGIGQHRNLTVAYIPRVGILIGHHAFDLSILYSRREENHLFLLILTILFRPGVGILIFYFRKCQNPHPMPPCIIP